MMQHLNKYNRRAAVLGAAEGLGKAYAELLADFGFDLFIVDHQEEKLFATQKEMEHHYSVKIAAHVYDLSDDKNWEDIVCILLDNEIGIVVFNAAYGPVMTFGHNKKEDLNRYLDLNIRSTVHLVYQLLVNRNPSQPLGVIIMSSLSALFGTKWITPYSASKAFLQNFAEGLYYEYTDEQVDILSCSAGMIDTPGFRSSKPMVSTLLIKPQSTDQVAREALNALGKKPIHITGRINRLSYFVLLRLLPRSWSAKIVNSAMSQLYSSSILHNERTFRKE